MPVLPRPFTWDHKPPFGTEIDPFHPLAPALLAAWNLSEGEGRSLYDASPRRAEGTIQGSNLVWGTGESGPVLRHAAQDGASFADLGTSFNPDRFDPWSFELSLFLPSLTRTLCVGNTDGSTFAGISLDLNLTAGGVRVLMLAPPLSYIDVTTPTDTLAVGWNHIVVTYTGSSTASGLTVYVNGAARPLSVTWDALAGSIKTGLPWCVGRGGTFGDLPPPAGTAWAAHNIYNRALTPPEVQSLYRDPWGLYRPAAINNWAVVSVGGGAAAFPGALASASAQGLPAGLTAGATLPGQAAASTAQAIAAILAAGANLPGQTASTSAQALAVLLAAGATLPASPGTASALAANALLAGGISLPANVAQASAAAPAADLRTGSGMFANLAQVMAQGYAASFAGGVLLPAGTSGANAAAWPSAFSAAAVGAFAAGLAAASGMSLPALFAGGAVWPGARGAASAEAFPAGLAGGFAAAFSALLAGASALAWPAVLSAQADALLLSGVAGARATAFPALLSAPVPGQMLGSMASAEALTLRAFFSGGMFTPFATFRSERLPESMIGSARIED